MTRSKRTVSEDLSYGGTDKKNQFAILKTTYDAYYSDQKDIPIDTSKLLKEVFPTNTPSKNYSNINYLEQKGYLRGIRAGGYFYPLAVNITLKGIDYVELQEPSICKLHCSRRIKILDWLYDKYSKDQNSYFTAGDIIQATNIGKPDSFELLQEFFYLQKKGLIETNLNLNSQYLPDVQISSLGVTCIEKIFTQL